MKPIENARISRAKGKWGLYFVCKVCGEKHRTMMGVMKHLLDYHDEGDHD